mgnify:CR=1 FL=1
MVSPTESREVSSNPRDVVGAVLYGMCTLTREQDKKIKSENVADVFLPNNV